MATKYPVITLTGPRQSGKTTLVRQLFKDKPYASLEDIELRQYALTDPKGFLALYKVIDEIQHVPDLLSYIQGLVDENDVPGSYIVTGSQNFALMAKITQSLAGRTAILELLPLSYAEIKNSDFKINHPKDIMFTGGYPRIYKADIQPVQFYKDYAKTYIERDVRQLLQVADLDTFQKFLQLCAARTGQLVNLASLSSDCSIAQVTAKNWLSLLKASYIVFTLQPHNKNFNKRLIKQPKLYFYDTGLAAFLLGLKNADDLWQHHMRGALFENFVITELIKQRWNQGENHDLYFWRDHHGHEVDVLLAQGDDILPIEIKSGQTIMSDFFEGLTYYQKLAGIQKGMVIYAGTSQQIRAHITVAPWTNLNQILSDFSIKGQ